MPVKGVSELQEESQNGPQRVMLMSSKETIAIKLWIAVLVSKKLAFYKRAAGFQADAHSIIPGCLVAGFIPASKMRPIRVEPREKTPVPGRIIPGTGVSLFKMG